MTGTADSNTLAATVTFSNTNDAPVLTSAALTLSEGATVVLAAADIGITDPDSTAFTYTVSGVTHDSFETLVGATWEPPRASPRRSSPPARSASSMTAARSPRPSPSPPMTAPPTATRSPPPSPSATPTTPPSSPARP
ncbi:MAG: hypothetical protein U1E62_08105 [Alsobacter sp.]